MSAAPPPGRLQNWPDPEPSCPWCLNDGLVTVPTPKHAGGDETGQAPCPFCVRGFRIEFAIGVKRNSRGEVVDEWHENIAGGPWGKDGYWQGRDTNGVQQRDPVATVNGRPDWIVRWQRARKKGDPRVFPEQLSALEQPPGEPLDDANVYVQPDEYLHGPTADDILKDILASV